MMLVLRLLLGLVFLVMALWATGALYYSNLPEEWMRQAGAGLFALISIILLCVVRPWWRTWLFFLFLFGSVVVWFLFIPASNQRNWRPDVAVLPHAEVKGDKVTIHNMRYCDYRTETNYTVRHYDKTFDLTKLRTVDVSVVHWGSPHIAHTMVSYGFEGGDYVCFSIETRMEKGEGYSAIKGFFRQFELTYVVADERDLIRLRTNFRNEQVYLYRMKTDPRVARQIFLRYASEMNRLREKPEWYNVVTRNCTTDIRTLSLPFAKNQGWDWRILINGYVDELAYDNGALDRRLPFEQLKARSLINQRAQAAGDSSSFSRLIRVGM
jgi:hypothetical protein